MFTRIINVTVTMSGIFYLYNVTCKQHRSTLFSPFWNGTKNGDIDGMSKDLFTCNVRLRFSLILAIPVLKK